MKLSSLMELPNWRYTIVPHGGSAIPPTENPNEKSHLRVGSLGTNVVANEMKQHLISMFTK